MAPTKIMIIRHAEKPDQNGGVLGIDESGRPDPNQLSVRGWQRTGALVPFFASAGQEGHKAIATPSAIFACKPNNGAGSVRSFSTVSPLAGVLGIPVIDEFEKSDDSALRDTVNSISGIVLICWSHKLIPGIARGLAGEVDGLPREWPAGRFDLVWILDRTAGGWSFSQRGQLLLPGDTHSN